MFKNKDNCKYANLNLHASSLPSYSKSVYFKLSCQKYSVEEDGIIISIFKFKRIFNENLFDWVLSTQDLTLPLQSNHET